ncbi:MAG TPA: PepSY domain-containing protein [Thermoanaerobaculia bacterium]
MKTTCFALALALALAITAPSGALPAKQPVAAPPRSDVPANLAREAKIPLEKARSIALARVPGGTVQSEELEREKGKLIYSFDIKVAKKAGVEEVGVDALTGKVVEQKHETPKAEKAEAKAEKKETPKKPR